MSEQVNLGTLPTEVQLSIIRHLLRFTNLPIQEHSNRTGLKIIPCRRDKYLYGENCIAIDKAEDLTKLPVSPRTYPKNLSTKLTTKYLEVRPWSDNTHVQINFGPSFIAWSALKPQERVLADNLQCMSRLWKNDIVAKKGEAYWHYGAGRSGVLVVVAEKLSLVKQVTSVRQSVP